MRRPPLAAAAVLLLVYSWALADTAEAAAEHDPYRILGIGRKATQPEIRKAYKRLAKEWYVYQYRKHVPALSRNATIRPRTDFAEHTRARAQKWVYL